MKTKELAAILGVDRRKVAQAVSEGYVRADVGETMFGKKVYYIPEEEAKIVEENYKSGRGLVGSNRSEN